MYFLQVNDTFHNAVIMIHDVIESANILPYTAIFMFDGVRKK